MTPTVPFSSSRALLDDAVDRPLSLRDVARLANYAREGVGMFWWGGYGISTEHTAYLNLKNGVPAPQSGSIRQTARPWQSRSAARSSSIPGAW